MPRYAAIDIGSNSVRMLAAEVSPGAPPRVLAEERQVKRLGESVFRTGRISPEAIDAVCGLLEKMASTYAKLDVVGVRAVATAAVRDASNQQEFLERASAAIKMPVEIISGLEEGRLIHLGVMSRWPHPGQRVLIVDVGGGSCELVLSEQGQMMAGFSKPLGAVRLTEVFLKHDPPEPRELHRLDEYIQERIAGAVERMGGRPFDRAIATSASAAAVVSAVNRIPRQRRGEADRLRATAAQVRKIYRELAERDVAARRKIPGIGPRRAEIVVAGAAVFHNVLRELNLPSLYYCAAGVRDGIIADLAARGVGRELSRLDAQQRRVVEDMARRYGVPLKHARKVAGFARHLFETLQPLHQLPATLGKLLEASAYLHDTGHYVSDTAHHKHSSYLVANSDLPGFRDDERHLIAILCRYHRKSLPSTRHPEFQSLDPNARRVITLLVPLLRLADSLDRSHDQRLDAVQCSLRNGDVQLCLESEQDIDLEQWAAERVSELFRQVYGRGLSLLRARR